MKQKFDFTPEGVAQKMDQLYAQSPTAIEAEAVAVETNCNGWIADNFELSPTQIDYMTSLGSTFSIETGDSLAHAFRHRTPVTMTKGDAAVRSYKFIRREHREEVTYAPDAEPEYTETLNFYIS